MKLFQDMGEQENMEIEDGEFRNGSDWELENYKATCSKPLLLQALNGYEEKRKSNASEYHWWGLFSCSKNSFSRTTKLSAVQKLKDDLGGRSVKYSPEEKRALFQGDLGKALDSFQEMIKLMINRTSTSNIPVNRWL